MKKLATTFIAAMAMLAMAGPLYAAGEGEMTTDTEQQTGAMQAISPEELNGMQVVSQTGEKLGKISEVKIDEQTGQINFVHVSKGGFLGIGGEDRAVPLEAFQFDQENNRATLTVDQSKFDNAPQQANLSDQDYQRELESHYGISPAYEQESDQIQQPGMEMDRTQQPGMEMDQTQQPDTEMDQNQQPGMGQDPAPQTN